MTIYQIRLSDEEAQALKCVSPNIYDKLEKIPKSNYLIPDYKYNWKDKSDTALYLEFKNHSIFADYSNRWQRWSVMIDGKNVGFFDTIEGVESYLSKTLDTSAVIANQAASDEDQIIWKETSQYSIYAKIGTTPRFAFIDYNYNDLWEVNIDNSLKYSLPTQQEAKKYVEDYLKK